MKTKRAPKPMKNFRDQKRWRWVVAVLALVAIAGAVVYVRGREEPAPSAAEVQMSQRYCELSTRFDGVLAGAGLPAEGPLPASVSPDSLKRALTEMGPSVDELATVAPGKVRDDVRSLVDAVRRAAAGDRSAATAAGFTDARRRVAAFGQKLIEDPRSGCQSGGGSGEG